MKTVSLATIALVLLLAATFISTAAVPIAGATSSSSSDPNATIYAHYDPAVSLNGGIVGNTTQKFHASAQTTTDTSATSTAQMVWSFNMYPSLVSAVTVPASSSFTVKVYIANNGSLSGVTVGAQMNEYCGTDSSPWGGEATTTQSLTTATTAYTVTITTGSSAVTVNSGCSFHVIVYVNPNTAKTQSITISYDSSTTPTQAIVPLNEWKSVSIANSVPSVATDTDVVTATVSDAFGLYDLSAITFTAASPRGQVVSAAMSIASGTPTSASGNYAYSLTPFTTTDQGWPGTWTLQTTLTDKSSNTLQSTPIHLIYDLGGSGTLTTTTGQPSVGGMTFSPSDPVLDVIVVLVLVLIAIGVYKSSKKK
ncbi:MAG: hypothetical protein JRM82_04790 [Nitrososphaerota archaeon]|nr:hypothetical protein [Nitrososphaerota archaeon]